MTAVGHPRRIRTKMAVTTDLATASHGTGAKWAVLWSAGYYRVLRVLRGREFVRGWE